MTGLECFSGLGRTGFKLTGLCRYDPQLFETSALPFSSDGRDNIVRHEPERHRAMPQFSTLPRTRLSAADAGQAPGQDDLKPPAEQVADEDVNEASGFSVGLGLDDDHGSIHSNRPTPSDTRNESSSSTDTNRDSFSPFSIRTVLSTPGEHGRNMVEDHKMLTAIRKHDGSNMNFGRVQGLSGACYGSLRPPSLEGVPDSTESSPRSEGRSHLLSEDAPPNEMEHHSPGGAKSLISFKPVPFDLYHQRRGICTPSIYSSDSELECNSPTFPSSCKALDRASRGEGTKLSSQAVLATRLVSLLKSGVSRELLGGNNATVETPDDDDDGLSDSEEGIKQFECALPVPLVGNHWVIPYDGDSGDLIECPPFYSYSSNIDEWQNHLELGEASKVELLADSGW